MDIEWEVKGGWKRIGRGVTGQRGKGREATGWGDTAKKGGYREMIGEGGGERIVECQSQLFTIFKTKPLK